MANNFAEAFLGARDRAQDRVQQQRVNDFNMEQAQLKASQAQDDRGNNQLVNMARGWKTVQPANRQAYYESFIKPALTQQFGDPGPYDEAAISGVADQILAAYGGGQQGGAVQSTYVDATGNRVAIMRDGSTQVLGQNAPNNQIIDTGNGYVGVNRSSLRANPVTMGGGQPPAQIPAGGSFMGPDGIPVQMDPGMDPAVQQAIMANPQAWAGAPDGSTATLPPQQSAPQQLRAAPKPSAVPAGYRQTADGNLEIIPGGPAQVAADARSDASAARKAAEDVKTAQKAQEAQQRKVSADETALGLISAIDTLTNSPGYGALGTAWGDAQINVPVIRNDAKDANAQLKTIGSQIAMATLAKLKSLSSTGATGFGALSNQELNLIQNSISNLQAESLSNAELSRSLKTIRDLMQKTVDWKAPAEYSLGQTIEANGKRYRITGLDDPNDPDVEEIP